MDPVTLGLITQLELDAVVKAAAEKEGLGPDARKGVTHPQGPTLLPAEEALVASAEVEAEAEADGEDED